MVTIARWCSTCARCFISTEQVFSFIPGFSPVIKEPKNRRNRFNGLHSRLSVVTPLLTTTPAAYRKAKPLKRFSLFSRPDHRAEARCE